MAPPRINIDWDEFFKLVSYQCTQIEIADFFGVSVDLLEDACRRDLDTSLADLWAKKKSLGKVRIRKAQFAIMEGRGPGAAAMAIWLDKKTMPDEQPLERQPLPPPVEETSSRPPRIKSFEEFMEAGDYPAPYPKQLEMRRFIFDETATRLMLGARGYGKTDYTTVGGTAYQVYLDFWWYRYGGEKALEETILVITKSKPRNTAMIEEIAMLLEKNGVPLEKKNSREIRVEGLIGKDSSVEFITIKTSMRGRHPKRILMDDPVTEEDTSEATRALVKKKYDEAMKLCKNLALIGQPAHAFDLYSELRGILLKMEIPHGSIPELDVDLDAMRLAGVDQKSIEMSYHLRIPKDGASIFSNLRFIDKFINGESVAFLDPSDGGDYSALSIFKIFGEGVAVQGHAWKKAWFHCVDDLAAICVARGVKRLCVETNFAGSNIVLQLRELLAPFGIAVVGIHSSTNKHATIISAGAIAHMIHLSKESDRVYTDHVVKYEYGSKFDDAPDSLARGLVWLGLIRAK